MKRIIAMLLILAALNAQAAERFANFLTGTVANAAASTANVIVVSSSANFPGLQVTNADFFRLTLQRVSDGAREIIYVTNYVGATCQVTRAQESTSAMNISSGDGFRHQVTAGMLGGINSRDTLTLASPTGTATTVTIQVTASRAATLAVHWRLIDAGTPSNTPTKVPPTGSFVVEGVKVTSAAGAIQFQFTNVGANRTWYLQLELDGAVYISEAINLG